ncbi:transposase IS4 family domain protein [Clostridium sporogenes]|nr:MULTISPECIES: hypothetical protein [Clostridium]APF28707.1 transposase IS4 family domain protein [Clostridium sporogenes]MDI6920508.1 hypothetical protein [Clostridium botulinum]
MLFQKFIELIDWKSFKIAPYKLNINYLTIENHLTTLIDSSTISTCIAYFKWAEFRASKAGIKVHTKFDLGKGIPETIVVTNAK